MLLKWLFYLLDAAVYPLSVVLAFWLADKVDFGGSDAAGQGMAAGFGALAYAAAGVVVCFVASLVASYKLLGKCWPAVTVFVGLLVVLLLWWILYTY